MNRKNPALEEIAEQIMTAEGNIVVEAGAGTGKTYNLTRRILYLITEKGIGLDQLLVMTFTDYAAAEMRDRVYAAISEAIGTIEDEEKRNRLIRQKRDFSKNYISTFHSFCKRIIGYYPEEVATISLVRFPEGLDNEPYGRQQTIYPDAGLEVLSNYDELLLKRDLLKEFYSVYKNHPGLQAQLALLNYSTLDRFLKQLSAREDSDLMQIAHLAPADYAELLQKLRDEIHREQQSLENEIWHVICSHSHWFKKPEELTDWETFNAVCRNRKGDIKKAKLGNECKDEAIARLNPLLLREYPLQNRYRQLDDCLAGGVDRVVRELADYRQSDNFNPEYETYHNMTELADLSLRWSAFSRFKRVSRGLLNFDDIIWFTLRLFREKPAVVQFLSRRFRYIMIDEFQDTDDKQWEIVKSLASLNRESKILIVGDVRQAIYSFRGGDVTMMNKARREMKEAAGDRYLSLPLAWSFRSNDSIINFVNALFDFCFEKAGQARPYMAEAQRLLRPANKDGRDKNIPGRITLLRGDGANIDSSRLSPNALKLYESETFRLEGLRIAEFLHRIRRGDCPGYEHIHQLMKKGETAVGMLFRRRTKMMDYEQALKVYGLPYTVSSGRGFFTRQEVVDCYNLLAFLLDAFDDLSLAGVLRSPFAGLSDNGLLTIRNILDSEDKPYANYWQAVENYGSWADDSLVAPDRLAVEAAARYLGDFRNKSPYTRVSDLLEEAIFSTNFLSGFSGEQQAEENVSKLIEIVRELESAGRGNLFEIVNFLRMQVGEAADEADAELPEPGIIQLMTIHGSKGLQFPMVVLPDMCAYNNSGGSRISETPNDDPLTGRPLFSYNPKDRDSREDDDESSVLHQMIREQCLDRSKAELSRLFYVALTRAESHLLLGHTVDYPKIKNPRKNSFSELLQNWINSVESNGLPGLHGNGSTAAMPADRSSGTSDVSGTSGSGNSTEGGTSMGDRKSAEAGMADSDSGQTDSEVPAPDKEMQEGLFVTELLDAEKLEELAGMAAHGIPQNPVHDGEKKAADLNRLRRIAASSSSAVITTTGERFHRTSTSGYHSGDGNGESGKMDDEGGSFSLLQDLTGSEKTDLPADSLSEIFPAGVKNQWKNIHAADAGTLVHRLIELNPSEEELPVLAANLLLSMDYNEAAGRIKLNLPVLKRHIANAVSFLESYIPDPLRKLHEVSFEMRDEARPDTPYIRGTIDLLIQDQDENWHLIDFKTAVPIKDEPGEFAKKQSYFEQLKIYRQAFASLTGKSIPGSRSVILFTGYEGGWPVNPD